MSNRTDRAETLDSEEIRDSTLSQDFVCSFFKQFFCLLRRAGYIPDRNYKIISPQVPEFY